MQFKRQIKVEDSINVTPLIDVVFLLLIFFMVSTTFTKETHLKIDLPESNGDILETLPNQIEVIVDARGGFSVNGRALVNKQLSNLRTAIQEVAAGETSIPFVITGDAGTPYQSIISVMDLAGQMGFSNLKLTTQLPQDAEKAAQ